MAREDVSKCGLPSPEERRQILQRAGVILDRARDLMALLDLHESSYPRSGLEQQQVLERVGPRRRPLPFRTAHPRAGAPASHHPAANPPVGT